MSFDNSIKNICTQLNNLTLEETTPGNAPANPPSFTVAFPEAFYQEAVKTLQSLFQVKLQHETVGIAIQRILDSIIASPSNRGSLQRLLQEVRITGSELYRMCGWNHLNESHIQDLNLFNEIKEKIAHMGHKTPDSLTIQFLLRPNFVDTFRFAYTLHELFKFLYPGAIHIPFLCNARRAQFGVVVPVGSEKMRLHFEYIAEQNPGAFAPAESLYFNLKGLQPCMLDTPERWMVDNLWKSATPYLKAPYHSEKILDYIQRGYVPSGVALSLFQAEFGGTDLQHLFERQAAGKGTEDALKELFLIISLLRKQPLKDLLHFALSRIDAEYKSWRKELVELMCDDLITPEQLFSLEEVICRIDKTLATAGSLSDISESFLEIDPSILKRKAVREFIDCPRVKDERDVAELEFHGKIEPNEAGYLVALALALTGKFPDMIEHVLTHFAAMRVTGRLQKGTFRLLELLGLQPPGHGDKWTPYLLRSEHPICKKVGFALAKNLNVDQVKHCIKRTPFLTTLRLIEQIQSQASERDVKEWINTTRDKELLFEVLTKNDDTRWVELFVQEAFDVGLYKPLEGVNRANPQVAIKLLEALSASPQAKTEATRLAGYWSDRSIEEQKGNLSLYFPLLLTTDMTPFLKNSLVYLRETNYTFSQTTTDALRAHFRRWFPLLEPLDRLTMAKLHQDLCKDTLSNQIKKQLETDYSQCTDIPKELADWYVHHFTKAPPPSLLPNLTAWKKRCQGAATEAHVFAQIVKELLSYNGEAEAVHYNILLESASTANLDESFQLLAQPLPKIVQINHAALWRVLGNFAALIDLHPERNKKHAVKLHSWFWEIEVADELSKKELAWRLLRHTASAHFEASLKLLEYALESTLPSKHSREAIAAFLEAAKAVHEHPLSLPIVSALYKVCCSDDTDTVRDQLLIHHLASYTFQEEIAYYSPIICRVLIVNPKNREALTLACAILDSNSIAFGLFTLLEIPELQKTEEYMAAFSRNYKKLLKWPDDTGDGSYSEDLLTLDLRVVGALAPAQALAVRKSEEHYFYYITLHFARHLGLNGWNDKSREFLDKISSLFLSQDLSDGQGAGQGAGQEYTLQDKNIEPIPRHLAKLYPVDEKTPLQFQYGCHLVLQTRKATDDVLAGEKAYAQLLAFFFISGMNHNHKLTGAERACVLHFAAACLWMLVDSYSQSANCIDLLKIFSAGVSEGPFLLAHGEATHMLLELAKARGIQFDAMLTEAYDTTKATQSTHSLVEIEKKLDILATLKPAVKPAVIQEVLPKYLNDLLNWQLHNLSHLTPDRSRLIKKMIDLWTTFPAVEKLHEVYITLDALIFPYQASVDSGDIEWVKSYFTVYDHYTKDLALGHANKQEDQLPEFLVMGEHSAVPFALLMHLITLFSKISADKRFSSRSDDYLSLARDLMSRIGPERKISFACALTAMGPFTHDICCNFGSILSSSQQITLITEWITLLLTLPPKPQAEQIKRLAGGILVANIIPRFKKEEYNTLGFWLNTFSEVEGGIPNAKEIAAQASSLMK